MFRCSYEVQRVDDRIQRAKAKRVQEHEEGLNMVGQNAKARNQGPVP